MFFGGYFVRSASPLPNPSALFSIFSRAPPSSFPFIGSSLATASNLLRDALAIFQCFWPLFLMMFCISLLACLVQQYIFAFLSFAFWMLAQIAGLLWDLGISAVDPVIRQLPFNLNALRRNKKRSSGVAGRQRSLSRGMIR